MKKHLLRTIFSAGAFAPFHWVNRKKLLVLTYHRFSRTAEPGKISAAEFESHLRYLSHHNNVVTLSDAVEHVRTGRELPPNPAVITIDDGYRDAFDIAFPILEKAGLPATLYAITDFVDQKIWLWTDVMRFVMRETKRSDARLEFEDGDIVSATLDSDAARMDTAERINRRLKRMSEDRKREWIDDIAREMGVAVPELPPVEFAAMSWDDVRTMDARGVAVESHTVTHPILTNISDAELEREMTESKERLESELDRSVIHFCYPNGSFDRIVVNAAKQAGYSSAVTTEYGFNRAAGDPFLINRIDAQSAVENFAQSASGFESIRQRFAAAA